MLPGVYDVIVIGARCGGSPTAMLLARRGHRVLLVDRATFPGDVVCTHFLTVAGVARLRRWGLLERVVASGCPPIHTVTYARDGVVLRGAVPPVDGLAEQYCVRRHRLDAVLVEAAVDSGAELREGFVVHQVLFDGDRVTGIRGRDAAGAEVVETARLVVGADGLHSLVAAAVGAPRYAERPPLTCTYYGYWSGVPLGGAEFRTEERRAVVALPTNDGLACIAVQWPVAETPAFRADVEGSFLRTLGLVPGLAERVRSGARIGPFVGTADLPNFFRRPWGPGWALVGDAGYHKDPHLAQGMSDAFRDADLLAEAADAGLSGDRPIEAALHDYERRRNSAARAGYDLNTRLATLEPPGEDVADLLGRARESQEETDRCLGILLGALPVPELTGAGRPAAGNAATPRRGS